MAKRTLYYLWFLLLFFLITNQTLLHAQENPMVPEQSREADPNFQNERQAWINQMHRAEPGVNWRAIDAETREAKFQALETSRNSHSQELQGFGYDTIAGGRMIGRWSERGSNNISGRMHTADIDFDHYLIYAASAMGNIWRADLENPNVWTSLNDDHRFGDIRMLRVITTSKGKRIIAAANGPAAVHYSDDGGTTWMMASGLDGPKSWGGFRRGVMAADERTIFLFGNEWDYKNWKSVSTLYRSVDAGKTFTNLGQWDFSSDKCDVWVSRDATSPAYFLKGDSLYQCQPSGALKYIQKIVYTDSVGKLSSLVLQGAVKDGTITLGILENGGGISNFFVSSDAGNNWGKTGEMIGNPFSANSFKILSNDPHIMTMGTNDCFVSRNNGSSWDRVNSWADYYGDPATKLHADIDGIDVFRNPVGVDVILVSTDGGIYMSTDSMNHFSNLTQRGIGTSQYYSVLTTRQAPYYIYGGTQDQGYQRTFDSAAGRLDMVQTISGDYGHLGSSDSGKSVWCDYPGFVMYYPDAQKSSHNRSWNFRGTNHLWLAPVISDPLDPQSAYVANGGTGQESFIWHLKNGIDSINYDHWAFDFSEKQSGNVSAMAFSPFDAKTCYVATTDGKFFRSSNTGASWAKSDSVKFPGSHYFYGEVILPSKLKKNELWIAGAGYSNAGVYHSVDNGASFSAVDSASLPHTMVFSLTASEDEKFLFVATEVGPYIYSVEAGKWFDMSLSKAPDMVYWSVDYIPSIKTVRFGSHGRGIWDYAIATPNTSVELDSTCPPIPNFKLSAVPTPFSHSTLISFVLPSAGVAAVRIYDLTGRLVRTIANESLDSGYHHIRWNGATDNGVLLPSGYYTCIASGFGKTDFVKVELVR